jgi:hypothetical protein
VRRPATLTAAAVILAALGLLSLATPLLAAGGGPPLPIVIVALVFGIAELAAAVGLWRCKRWAAWVGVIVSLLNALSAAPGLSASLGSELLLSIVATLAGAVVVVVLALLPASRKAYS